MTVESTNSIWCGFTLTSFIPNNFLRKYLCSSICSRIVRCTVAPRWCQLRKTETEATTTWHSKSVGVYVLPPPTPPPLPTSRKHIRHGEAIIFHEFSSRLWWFAVYSVPALASKQKSPAIVRRRFLLTVHLLPKIMTWVSHINNLRYFLCDGRFRCCHLIFTCGRYYHSTWRHQKKWIKHSLTFMVCAVDGIMLNSIYGRNGNEQTMRSHPHDTTFENTLIYLSRHK